MKIQSGISALAWLLPLLSCLALAQRPPDSEPKLPNPVDVLSESHTVGAQLPPADRCFLYLDLAESASRVAPEMTKRWTQEVFDTAQQLPASWNRAALRKNAIQVLAAVDPALAFAMIPLMEQPIPDPSGTIPQDLRAYVAGRVYPAYWALGNTEARKSAIRAQALALATNGQYPFSGIVPVLESVAKRDPQEEEAWWSEIVRTYAAGGGEGIRDTDARYIAFLKATWKISWAAGRKGALEEVVKRVLNRAAGNAMTKGQAYQAVASTSAGPITLADPSLALLFDILPQIRDTAPDLLEEIVKRNPAFSAAKAGDFEVRSVKQMVVYGAKDGPPPAQSTAGALLGEQAALDKAVRLAHDDPAAALRMAMDLTTYRYDAFDRVAEALPDATPEAALGLAGEAATQLKSAKSKLLRLKLLVLQAASTQSAKPETAEAAIREGLDLGESLFGEFMQTHPAAGPDEAPAIDSLRRLAGIGVRVSPWNTLGYVRGINDLSLRAWLLLAAADGLRTLASKAVPRPAG